LSGPGSFVAVVLEEGSGVLLADLSQCPAVDVNSASRVLAFAFLMRLLTLRAASGWMKWR
jgi:hypothetical protein